MYGPSRLARIDEEIRADHDAFTRFAHFASIVGFADRERYRALVKNGPHFGPSTHHNASSRMQENFAFMQGTLADLSIRCRAY